MEKVYWTASNNSSFLNGCRDANSLKAAVRSARHYVRNELLGEGRISYFYHADDLEPFRIDEKSIFTNHRWKTIT